MVSLEKLSGNNNKNFLFTLIIYGTMVLQHGNKLIFSYRLELLPIINKKFMCPTAIAVDMLLIDQTVDSHPCNRTVDDDIRRPFAAGL